MERKYVNKVYGFALIQLKAEVI